MGGKLSFWELTVSFLMTANEPITIPNLDPDAIRNLLRRAQRFGVIRGLKPIRTDNPARSIEAINSVIKHSLSPPAKRDAYAFKISSLLK